MLKHLRTLALIVFVAYSQAQAGGLCGEMANRKGQYLTLKAKGLAGLRMFYEYQPPTHTQNKTYLLIHALAVDSSTLKPLAAQLKREGHGVLLVDLLGHGKTLESSERRRQSYKDSIHFENQILAIQEVVESLGLAQLLVVGHSYGGAIALKLAEHERLKARIQEVYAIAPYLQRMDHYHREKAVTAARTARTNFVDWTSQVNPLFGFYHSWWESLYPGLTDQTMDSVVRGTIDNQNRAVGDSYLRFRYSQLIGKLFPGDPLHSAKVEGAIKAVNDAQHIDLLRELPEVGDVPVRIIYLGKDELLPKELVQHFYSSMLAAGTRISFHEIPGASHLGPIELPSLVARLLLKLRP
jgi:pimeloyl-ACP methyl ester carboxylesterase